MTDIAPDGASVNGSVMFGWVFSFIPFISIVWAISTSDAISHVVVVFLRYSVACMLGTAVGVLALFGVLEITKRHGGSIWSLRGSGIVIGVPLLGIFVLSVPASIGAIGYGIMTALDPSREVLINPIEPLISFVLAVVTLSYAFYIKCIFNALLLGATLTWWLYFLLVYGEGSLIPIFQLLFDLVASSAPEWFRTLYIVISLGYSAVTAIVASVSFEWSNWFGLGGN
jgi:hypothetical protein